ncbi:MAG: flagellar biosynthesis protein FlhA [Deltaproteobacteria bacterium]|nr:flagellar biosynthesis protein FlhA [Deltaproteobacteria bacterium]
MSATSTTLAATPATAVGTGAAPAPRRAAPIPATRGVARPGGGPESAWASHSLLAAGTIGIVGVMVLPLPPVVLDVLLALSISLSLVVFLLSLQIERPLEFSAFPSVLLIVTLLRLALNIASTRLILLHGNEGPAAAGHVIQAFGQFGVGGNTLVGVVVFLILIIINFVVITKGAGRIAEVAARFTLDAMPGKQMAVDADLAAGLITDREARSRRREVEQEADFFGAMDGASKFVRGDAVAGLVVTAVNIFGGLVIGTLQGGLSIGQAATNYTSLTIGDGLVTQIPALLTSVAAGMVTTRAAAGGALGPAVQSQLFGARWPMSVAAVALLLMAVIPGMPHLAFLILAALLALVASRTRPTAAEAGADAPTTPDDEWAELKTSLPIDLLEIEVGYELVPLIDAAKDGTLLRRIAGVRKQLAQDLGILVPPIHLRDNLRLQPGEYRILLSGNELGRAVLRPGRLLAMNPAGAAVSLSGEPTTEPAFGLDARWINPADRERADLGGYTVVDPSTVAATHLGELLAAHAPDLFGRGELQQLLDLYGREHGKLLEELIPAQLSHGQVLKVMKNLLRERVSIRDFRTILEALAEHAADTKDADQLTEGVRQRLSKHLMSRYRDPSGALHAFVLAPAVESAFRRMQTPTAGAAIDPNEVQAILRGLEAATRALGRADEVRVILVAADVRRVVAGFVTRHLPGLPVLSYRELDTRTTIRTVGIIGADPNSASSPGAR